MITAGVDIGAKNIKVVVVKDGIIKAKNITPTGFDIKESQENAWAAIENDSGLVIIKYSCFFVASRIFRARGNCGQRSLWLDLLASHTS